MHSLLRHSAYRRVCNQSMNATLPGKSMQLRKHLSTYAQQANLPRLPVPDIGSTLNRYLRSLQPLLSKKELAEVQTLAADFIKSEQVHALQAKLVERAKYHVNWLEEWWDGGVYTQPRLALPISYNYFLRFSDRPEYFTSDILMKNGISLTAVHRAAHLLSGMARFKLELDAETVTPDRDRDGVLCMSQYARLFGHARIPLHGEDEMRCYATRPRGLPVAHYNTKYMDQSPSHVAVMAQGRFYAVDILKSGEARRPIDIARDLLQVCAHAREHGAPPFGIGSLTTMERDAWATARQQLSSHSDSNRNSLHMIDSALWVVNLDEQGMTVPRAPSGGYAYSVPSPASSPIGRSDSLTAESPRYLFGRGDGLDRWFDKHQLTVCASGGAALLLEHAQGDGLTAVRLMNYCVGLEAKAPSFLDELAAWTDQSSIDAPVRHLPFDVPTVLTGTIRSSQLDALRTTSTLQTSCVYSDVGASAIKKFRLPPDAFMQMAFQLTHHRLFGFPGATYESTSTRSFAHGRTETTRSVTNESEKFVASLGSYRYPSALQARRQATLLAEACESHVQYAKAAKAGLGVDRHLLGLRMLAAEAKVDIPLLQHPSFALSKHWRLSTSNCGSEAVSLFGFGPVVNDGFGLAYLINGDHAVVNVTAWNNAGNLPRTSADAFASTLRDSIATMSEIGAYHSTLQIQ